jgi:pSer/pThr/pTyr-binding forkhead associated (FHA) protein
MTLASIAVEELLLALKIAFVVLLYLFIWRIVRTASRDLRLPQESFILAPSQAAGEMPTVRDAATLSVGRLVVVTSPTLREGEERTLDSSPVTVGRGPQNDVKLAGDDYASASHARLEPRGDGVWVEDVGSTNGTYLNGIRLTRARKLTPGDVVRIGETELRYEQ